LEQEGKRNWLARGQNSREGKTKRAVKCSAEIVRLKRGKCREKKGEK